MMVKTHTWVLGNGLLSHIIFLTLLAALQGGCLLSPGKDEQTEAPRDEVTCFR